MSATTLDRLAASKALRSVDVAIGRTVQQLFPDSHPDTALAAALAARAIADGHAALDLGRAQAWWHGLDPQAPALPETDTWRQTLRRDIAVASGTAPREDAPLILDAHGRIYLARYFRLEQGLARALLARAAQPAESLDQATMERLAALYPGDGTAIDEQGLATLAALRSRLSVITGGPGTGKTTTVARIVALLSERAADAGARLNVQLAAPTGKAAARLGEAMRQQRDSFELSAAAQAMYPHHAVTLHRLLRMRPDRPGSSCDAAHPLPADVVVVDEVSMVDLPMMARLLDAVHPDARLILLGDADQLASVEAGDVLGSIRRAIPDTEVYGTDFVAEAARVFGVELGAARQAQPLLDHVITLHHSHRFGAGGRIAQIAQAIRAGDAPAVVGALGSDANQRVPDEAAVNALIEDALARYRPILDAGSAAAALAIADGYRMLTALRRGPEGCESLDARLSQQLRRESEGGEWWRGRLILVTANRAELGLFNGDVGVVWPDEDSRMRVWFRSADGLRALAPAMLPQHEGAFAITVHKSQGSEFAEVDLLLGRNDSPVLTRELLYTGVTRARDAVRVWSAPDVLQATLARRVERFSGLGDRLLQRS